MKRNETKTRTVWYVQACVDGRFEDLKAFKTYADAWDFISDANLNDISARIVEAKVVGSSSYPEMLNARYEDSLKATEPVVEESKPSGQIVWRYKVQHQKPNMKAGWLEGGVFDTKEEAEKFCATISFWHPMPFPTRIRKVGELI
jgi:hypothetical protein